MCEALRVLGWRAVRSSCVCVCVCTCLILATEGARRLGDALPRAIMTAAWLQTTWSCILLNASGRERHVSCTLSVAGRPVARSLSVHVCVCAPAALIASAA
jgi:hypothetical protein